MKKEKQLQTWRLIRDKSHDSFTNMAVDEAIAFACGEGKSPATLRLYGWKLPTISIGYSQKVDDINLQYCKIAGIDIIKRPTGGRAVLHENELTYSVCSSIKNPLFPKNILKSHKKISEALLVGLKKLGIKPVLHYKTRKQISRHPVCFYAPSIYELVVDGKKIVGSAQRRFKKSFLEHGSIPLELNRKKLTRIFKNQFSLATDKLESLYFENMAALNELAACRYSCNQVAENIIEGFKEYFEINFKDEDLSDFENDLVKNATAMRGELK